jgi:hypothetical protein
MIVLDGFIYRREMEPLVLLDDIIKIDFRKESRPIVVVKKTLM